MLSFTTLYPKSTHVFGTCKRFWLQTWTRLTIQRALSKKSKQVKQSSMQVKVRQVKCHGIVKELKHRYSIHAELHSCNESLHGPIIIIIGWSYYGEHCIVLLLSTSLFLLLPCLADSTFSKKSHNKERRYSYTFYFWWLM